MTLAQADRLLSPKEAIADIHNRYGLQISLTSFYTMISRGEAPNVTYFRGRPKFTIADIDEWVRRNISNKRKSRGYNDKQRPNRQIAQRSKHAQKCHY